jgi:hypothetical protein
METAEPPISRVCVTRSGHSWRICLTSSPTASLDFWMPRDFITVVSGLPRSGTSLMMQMLAAGGLPPLMDNLRPPDESNPRGYFEFEPVKRLRSDRSWLDQARGHAIKIIHVLVRELPTDGRFQYRVILMKRPTEEILASQRTMLERQGKAGADEATLATIFRTHLAQLETWIAEQPAFSFLPVDYHRVLKEPLEVASEVNAFLQGNLNLEAMAAAVDPALYRHRLAKTD